MTLKELEYAYNFHDCYVFTPFEINEDCVTVTFDLAKHLQYEPLKSRYGDVLQISASASSGYNLSTFTVNGSNFTSGNTVTVTGAVTVVTTAGASASWNTVFSGNTSTSSSSLTINGIRANVPTKVTGRLYYHDPDYIYDEGSTNFTSVELPYTVSNTGGKVVIAKPTTANKLSLTFTRYTFDHPFMGTMTYDVVLYITKVEQYY